MELNKLHNREFLMETINEDITVGFSTRTENSNFNKNLDIGKKNLENLKEWFNVDELIYLNQVHGKRVYDYSKGNQIKNQDGDGIVTAVTNTIVGVFTADCVPVILVDEARKVVAALHSGWKGTLDNIVKEGIESMVNNYGSKPSNIKAFIGPHNKVCCYEVSEELINIFKEEELFKNNELINQGRHLNLQQCIEIELIQMGIIRENIKSLNLCTYCSKEVDLYSYRKSEQSQGRLFSFVFIHDMEE